LVEEKKLALFSGARGGGKSWAANEYKESICKIAAEHREMHKPTKLSDEQHKDLVELLDMVCGVETPGRRNHDA
jgi:hypothetical protein